MQVRAKCLPVAWRPSSGEVSSSPSQRASSAALPSCPCCLPARGLSSGAPPGPLSGCRNRRTRVQNGKGKLLLQKKHEHSSR